MSANHDVYVRPLRAGADPVDLIEREFGAKFAPAKSFDGSHFLAGRDAIDYFSEHDLEDNIGIPYESHPLIFAVRNLDRDAEHEYRVAKERIFDPLVATGDYSCFILFNTIQLLDRHVVELPTT
jgi:hypothetical protein